MLYSKSAEYAIRALVNLAQLPEGKFAMVKQIAEEEKVPTHFLAKILQQLARKGLLHSLKGPTGGFRLLAPATDISLLTIVEALDGLSDYQRCACGREDCSDQMPCGVRGDWKALRTHIMDFLEGTSIALFAEGVRREVPRSGQAVQVEVPHSGQAAREDQEAGRGQETTLPSGKIGWRERLFGLAAGRK